MALSLPIEAVISHRAGHTLYPALRALEREGLVRSWAPDPKPKRGGRPRVYYELPAMGAQAAHDERETLMIFMGLGATNA